MTDAAIAQCYRDHVTFAQGSEALVSTSTIAAYLTVHKILFQDAQLRNMINELEKRKTPPFNSIRKLLEIGYRIKSKAKLMWFVSNIIDQIDTGVLDPGEVSVRAIKAKDGQALVACSTLPFDRPRNLRTPTRHAKLLKSSIVCHHDRHHCPPIARAPPTCDLVAACVLEICN